MLARRIAAASAALGLLQFVLAASGLVCDDAHVGTQTPGTAPSTVAPATTAAGPPPSAGASAGVPDCGDHTRNAHHERAPERSTGTELPAPCCAAVHGCAPVSFDVAAPEFSATIAPSLDSRTTVDAERSHARVAPEPPPPRA